MFSSRPSCIVVSVRGRLRDGHKMMTQWRAWQWRSLYPWPQLFEGCLDSAIHRVNKTNHAIHWIVIYLVDSVIHQTNNLDLMSNVFGVCRWYRCVLVKSTRAFGILTPLCVNNMEVENSNLHVCFIASGHRRRTSFFVLQQLRAAIAPCIESVFLLDRLCYLYEQVY